MMVDFDIAGWVVFIEADLFQEARAHLSISLNEVNAGLCYLPGAAVALKPCHSFGAEYGYP